MTSYIVVERTPDSLRATVDPIRQWNDAVSEQIVAGVDAHADAWEAMEQAMGRALDRGEEENAALRKLLREAEKVAIGVTEAYEERIKELDAENAALHGRLEAAEKAMIDSTRRWTDSPWEANQIILAALAGEAKDEN